MSRDRSVSTEDTHSLGPPRTKLRKLVLEGDESHGREKDPHEWVVVGREPGGGGRSEGPG